MKQIEKYINGISELLSGDLEYYCDEKSCKKCDFNGLCNMSKQELIDYFSSEVPENHLSDNEYNILKNVNEEYKYIARDDVGNELYVYGKEKPEKMDRKWRYSNLNDSLKPFNHLFQFVKWEDDEPYEISKLIEAYEENHNEN